jgi:hypothetical protein
MAKNATAVIKKPFKKFGQKRITPDKNDALRKFYSSLHKQNPKSEMAMKWLLEHGLLSKKKTETFQLIAEMKKVKI